jgi:hypothetical protein
MVMILLPLSLLDSLRECYYWTFKSASKAFSTEILESIKKGKMHESLTSGGKKDSVFSREYFQSEKQYFPPN